MKPMKYLFLLLMLALSLSGCGEEEPVQMVMAMETVPMTTVAETTASTTEATAEATTAPTLPPEERFILTFVGDCTLGANPSNFYALSGFVKIVGEDYGYPFRNVIDYFAGDEFSFANLEGPLTDVGNPVKKTHAFHGPERFVNILTQNSVDFVSLANNHTMDYTQKGYDSTLRVLGEAGIPFVERDASTIVTTPNGLTIGVYGAVYYKLDVEDMVAEISALRETCDLVIYAPHWGVEKTYQPTQTQIEVGHAAIDAGADIVWGSHTHTLQPMETYENGIIFYSLGNFSFGGNGDPEDYDTALIQVEIIRSPDGEVGLGEVTVVPCRISSITSWNNFQPTPYEPGTKGYDRVMDKLTGSDQ